jgi:nucleotide-binding universal stress UspA family protein
LRSAGHLARSRLGTPRAIGGVNSNLIEEPLMEKILIATDFTDSSSVAFERALQLASQLTAELDIVHVAVAPSSMPAELIARGPSESTIEDAKRALAQMVAAAAGRGLVARSHLLVGDAVFGILEEVGRAQATLVVVGSHGKGLIRRALLGSVAERVCRHSPVPVVVVPMPARHAATSATAPIARSCEDCGHILGDTESAERCAGCGGHPAKWLSATISSEPIDAGEPAVGEASSEPLGYERTNDAAGLFATSPPGTEGYDVNPELRVRY